MICQLGIIWPDKWRYRRACLGLFHLLDRIFHGVRVHCRDGFDVRCHDYFLLTNLLTLSEFPHLRRPISLGFRVCAQKHTALFELACWYGNMTLALYSNLTKIPVGWISVTGWQVGLASLCFIVGTVIQGLIVLEDSTYVFKRWHGTLLVMAIVAFCIIFNSFMAKKLPMIEGMVLILHLIGFFGILIPLWVLAPRHTAADVFGTLTNLGGWPTTGLSFMVGLLTPVYTLLGADSAVHMSEEIRDASLTLPRAIVWSAAINGSLGFIMTITFCFTLGDLFEIIDSPTGYPFIQVFYNVTNSYAGTAVMTAIVIVNITSACISTVATVSRQTWSFARDRGLPFSGFIAHVSHQLISSSVCSKWRSAYRSNRGGTYPLTPSCSPSSSHVFSPLSISVPRSRSMPLAHLPLWPFSAPTSSQSAPLSIAGSKVLFHRTDGAWAD